VEVAIGAQGATSAKPPVPPPAPPAAVPSDAVVAKMGSRPVTAGEVKALLGRLPEDLRKAFFQNPKNAMQSVALTEYLAAEAEKSKAAEASPFREQIEFQRKQLYAQAEAARRQQQVQVSDEDVRKKYEAEKSSFDTARLRVILVAFADPKVPPPKPEPGGTPVKTLTEAEAKAKAEDLSRRARSGADFAELARRHSDDRGSAERGGESGSVRRGDNLPEEIRTAVFSLPPGGVSGPVKQGSGFFVIKVDDRIEPGYEDVKGQVAAALRLQRYQQWFRSVQKQYEVTIENPEFFGLAKPPGDPHAAPAAAAGK
jgi:parvulin-like peptidyl-prolyl isomerase